MKTHQTPLGRLALALAFGGVVLAFLITAAGSLLGHAWIGMAYLVFAAAEVVAFVCGLTVRTQPTGRAAAITSGVLLAVSLLLIA